MVRGDLVIMAEGDRVPADGVLVEARELLIDESLLTGESVPVRKRGRSTQVTAHPRGREAMICRTSSPQRWSCGARGWPK